MNVGLYRLAAAMTAQERSVESIARNLANVSTPGYKRTRSATGQFAVPGLNGQVRGITTRSKTDYAQGDIQPTGRVYDLALEGEGFFAVEGPQGELYTRHGAFQPNSEGILVTPEGFPVAWEKFSAPIDDTGSPISVDREGAVTQDGRQLGTLRLVNFKAPQGLLENGIGYWGASDRLAETTVTASVRQSALEGSNSTGIQEMIDLIQAQRAFEQTAKVLNNVRESYSRLTRPT